jgi:hypothetical protein
VVGIILMPGNFTVNTVFKIEVVSSLPSVRKLKFLVIVRKILLKALVGVAVFFPFALFVRRDAIC